MSKRAKRAAAVIVAFVLLLVGSALVFINTATFHQWVLHRIQAVAANAGYVFTAESLDLNLWNLQATVTRAGYDDGNGTRVSFERAFLEIPWDAFRGDVVRIRDLAVDGLAIEIRPTTAPSAPAESATLPRITFDRLAIRNGSFNYSDAATTIRIPGFTLETQNGIGALRLPQPVEIAPGTRFALPELQLTLSDGSLDFARASWRLDHPEISIAGSSLGRLQWAPALTLTLDYATAPFSYGQWRDLESSASVSYVDGVTKITNFRALAAGGSATGDAEFTAESKTADLNWRALNLSPAGLPAVADGNLRVRWNASDFHDLSGEGNVVVTSPQYGRAQSDVAIREGHATLNVTGNLLDAAVRANLKAGLDQSISGTFDVRHNVYGSVRLTGSLEGTLKDPQVQGKLTGSGINYEGAGPFEGEARASFRYPMLSVDDIRLGFKQSGASNGWLRADLKSGAVSGELPQILLELTDLAANATGRAVFNGRIEGTLQAPIAHLNGSSTGIDINGIHIDEVALAATATQDRLELSELSARQSAGELKASGTYDWKTQAIAGSANISNLQVVQVPDLSATASLDANFSGTPASPIATANGEVRDVVYRGEQLGNLEISAMLDGDHGTLQFRNDKYSAAGNAQLNIKPPYAFSAVVTADRSRIQYQQYDATANGTIGASGQIEPLKLEKVTLDNFTLVGNGVDVSAMGLFPEGVMLNGKADLAQFPVEGLQMAGEARVQAVVSGSLENPAIEGTVETSNATFQADGMDEAATIDAAVDFNRNEFTIRRLTAMFAGANAEVTGRGTLDAKGKFEFRADNIRPERFIKNQGLSGLVTVEGAIDVAGPQLEAVSGSARVTRLDLNLNEVEIHQTETAEITLKDQVVEARRISVQGLDTQAAITGTVDLRTQAISLNVDGNTDLKILGAFIPGSNPVGKARTSITVRGTPDAPDLQGFLNVADLQLQLEDPPILLTGANADIRLQGERIDIARFSGNINGGEFNASGGIQFPRGQSPEAAIRLEVVGAQTEYPPGFQSEISSRLSLDGTLDNLEVSGTVEVLNGLYNRDMNLASEVLSRISADTVLTQAASAGPSMIDSIRLNVAVETPGDVRIVNNMANFSLEGSFRLRGTVGNPVINGRATVPEGGELYFGRQLASGTADVERNDSYVISQGTIDFINTVRTEPELNFVATRQIEAEYQSEPVLFTITLRASGTPDNLKTELTSDPSLPQSDIMALLLTGRTFEKLQGSEVDIAREQAAAYLSGQFGNVFQTAGSAFGLNTVRIDPVLLAGEEDLSARLTVGKDITSKFNLVYSQNLAGPRAQTWIVSYKAIKDLLIRGINRSDDNNLTVELRHDLKWGGGETSRTAARPVDERRVGEITFEGTDLPQKDLLDQVTKTGKPFNAYRMNEDVRRLQNFLGDRGFLNAKVRPVRNPADGTVNMTYVIDQGPSIAFAFLGAKVPKDIQEEIRRIWIRGFAEIASLQQSRRRLLRYFRDEGFLQAAVSARDESTGPLTRRFVFDISPGPEFSDPRWVFRGIEPIDLNVSAGAVLEDPKAIQERIQRDLWTNGYINASCTVPELVVNGREAQFEIGVEQGPRYAIGKLTSNINDVLLDLPPGENGRGPGTGFFTSEWVERARQSIINNYWKNGFNDVQVTAATNVPQGATTVDVNFSIAPGEQQIVSDIRIEGYRTTNLAYIQSQFTFKEGDPVDYSRLNTTRKNLYDTRLFSRVDLDVVKGDNGYIAQAQVNERPPWNFRYGFAVTNQLQTNDRELGLTADLTYSNFLGRGITTGTSFKYTAITRDGRIFGSVPSFLGKNVTTTTTLFRTRDLSFSEIIIDLWGVTIQQQWRLRNLYLLSYDYSYKRNHTYKRNLDTDDPFAAFDETFPVARFNATLSRDTRNDILNATRGTFLSNSFEIAPPGIGSNIKFLKNYAQFLRFRPLTERVVWASAFRVGMAKGFHGQELIPTERFLAGGGTTLRGFQQDRLAEPGEGLFIINQELRFPLLWRFSGAAFMDAGNLYPLIKDFNPLRLRYSPGAGIRIETPLVLIRFDLGFNVLERPDEPRYRFSFGVGQAF